MDKTEPANTVTPVIRSVVIGGGTGAPVSIRALLRLDARVSAVVAMADDGGSTGVLREQPTILPPGDIRKCLISMAENPDSDWVRAFAMRLPYVDDHPLGNLMLTTLGEVSGSLPKAIELCATLLQARGRVFPSTLEKVELSGVTVTGQQLFGQAKMTGSENAIYSAALNPPEPDAYPEAVSAILDADLVVLGPGSLFTSIIPNLLVPGIIEAVRTTKALKVFLCSLADMQGETRGMTAFEHTDALLRHGMDGALDIVVAHAPEPLPDYLGHIRRVVISEHDQQQIVGRGVSILIRHLVDPVRPTWHDVGALAELFSEMLVNCRGLTNPVGDQISAGRDCVKGASV